MSSHLGIQVGEDIEKQRSLSWSSPVPHSPLCPDFGATVLRVDSAHGESPAMPPPVVPGAIRPGLDDFLGPKPVAKDSRLDLVPSLKQELGNFSIKDPIGNILIFLGHAVSVMTTHFGCYMGEQPRMVHERVGVAVFQYT